MNLLTCQTPAAQVTKIAPDHWELTIPPGLAGVYHNAQLDDYRHLSRPSFPWQAPLSFTLQARVSDPHHQGTWGFGFWNDPFAANLGLGGTSRRLPALPNAAWFFYASPPNHLALHDHPAQGLLAAVFRSPQIPSPLLAPGLVLAPLLFTRPTARLLRKMSGLLIKDEAAILTPCVTGWHTYRLDWQQNQLDFYVDQTLVFSTHLTPNGKLGLVLWIDNQYAAFPPNGKLTFGTLQNAQQSTLEIKDPAVTQL